MTVTYHPHIEQGSDEWKAIRCGCLTASEMKNIISPVKLEPVKNPAHLYEMLAQRITGYVEPQYISDDMLRGHVDEIEAKILYAKHYGDVEDIGFITNDKFGFKIGYSPDGMIGKKKAIECKSRRQKFQCETILSNAMPDEFRVQVQTAMLVAELDSIDFVSYSAGLPMVTIEILPDLEVQNAIINAATVFEERLQKLMAVYNLNVTSGMRLVPTERRTDDGEIIVT